MIQARLFFKSEIFCRIHPYTKYTFGMVLTIILHYERAIKIIFIPLSVIPRFPEATPDRLEKK